MIKTREDLAAYSEQMFRSELPLLEGPSQVLKLTPKEEFPVKDCYLVESLISKGEAAHFLEITGGFLTHHTDEGIRHEMFEASEALASKGILSLEEKFLAGEGQNITPARYATDPVERQRISDVVKTDLQRAAELLEVQGYARIDAFIKIFEDGNVETWIIEVNSLPGMTPATAIFHQAAINGYKPYEFIDRIMQFGRGRMESKD
jgi:D-alanine-D-alanine ligase